jgi:Tol biopolymer transport system component
MDQRVRIALLFCLCACAVPAFASEPTLVSAVSDGRPPLSGDSFGPSLSVDGHVIAFESRARLTTDDKNKARDVYVANMRTKSMRRVPPPSKLQLASGPSVSRDGHMVALHVYSSPAPSKHPRTADIYLYSIDDAALRPLFPSPRSVLKGGESLYPMLSRDNNTVLFTANSDERVRQVYVADRENGLLTTVSKNDQGTPGNQSSGMAKLSASGGACVFLSAATNLAAPLDPTSLSEHLYAMDLSENTMTRIDSFEHGFDDRRWMTGAFDISDNAQIVVFQAHRRSASNPFATLASSDLFIYDAATQKSTLMTEGLFSDASRSPSISGDGKFVVFLLSGKKQNRVVAFDREHSLWKEAAVGTIDNPVLSKNGCVIVFERQDKKVRNIYTVSNPFMESDDACH